MTERNFPSLLTAITDRIVIVDSVILDEPSTHVDESNMELLIPFFERLRDNLHTYGIAQAILIDHHPAWRNSSVGIIQLG